MLSSEEFKIKIRNAKKDDMLHVFEMIKELAVSCGKLEDEVKIDHTVLEKDGFGAEYPMFSCLVAELPDQTVVGYTLHYYSYSTGEGKSMILEDLYVKPSYRNYGIGKELFMTVVKTAFDLGLTRIDFHVLSWNPAVKFYKKMGAVDLSETENWTLFRMNCKSIQKGFYNF